MYLQASEEGVVSMCAYVSMVLENHEQGEGKHPVRDETRLHSDNNLPVWLPDLISLNPCQSPRGSGLTDTPLIMHPFSSRGSRVGQDNAWRGS